jgi:hypothetical protein
MEFELNGFALDKIVWVTGISKGVEDGSMG